jgi:small subunit ribosomal protein S21
MGKKTPCHAEVYIDERRGMPLERAMKRFKKQVERSGIMQILKEKSFYEKPSIKNKRKRDVAKYNAKRASDLMNL